MVQMNQIDHVVSVSDCVCVCVCVCVCTSVYVYCIVKNHISAGSIFRPLVLDSQAHPGLQTWHAWRAG